MNLIGTVRFQKGFYLGVFDSGEVSIAQFEGAEPSLITAQGRKNLSVLLSKVDELATESGGYNNMLVQKLKQLSDHLLEGGDRT